MLSRNCNHFTSYLCEKLTGKPAPTWLNRAAGIGLALPCVVPKEWIEPPDHDTAEGELLNPSDHGEESDIGTDTAASQSPKPSQHERDQWDDELDRISEVAEASSREIVAGTRPASVSDTSGRPLPPSERAPLTAE